MKRELVNLVFKFADGKHAHHTIQWSTMYVHARMINSHSLKELVAHSHTHTHIKWMIEYTRTLYMYVFGIRFHITCKPVLKYYI